MIIAPLMLPLRGLAFTALEGDRQLLQSRSILILASTM
ncbi:MAG: DUF389 domain-containing protein [Elainellaceae cyanobacterium]